MIFETFDQSDEETWFDQHQVITDQWKTIWPPEDWLSIWWNQYFLFLVKYMAAIEKKMWLSFPTCNRFSPRSSSTRFVSFLKAFGWTSRILQYWTKIFWRFVISSWNNVTVQNWPVVTIHWTARWRYQNESSSLSSIIIIISSVIRMRRIVSASLKLFVNFGITMGHFQM